MTRSGVALEHDIPNKPNPRQVSAMRELAQHVLEPLRQRFGPIVISSGFRSQQVNLLVGGAIGSQHLRGEAADIVVNDVARGLQLFRFIRDHLDFDQLIWEPVGAATPRWLHVSYTTRRKNRRQVIG
jgi:Peptidase M15.